MTPERLAAIRDRAICATEGPWAPWFDQDGQPHMSGMLMVGNAAAVIPEGETWIEGVDVNPIAHTYTPEDRRFIAHARTDVPDLLAEVDRLRAENDNLRAGAKSFVRQIDRLARGIEGIEAKADDYGQQTLANMANALLNPTEE